MSSCYKKNVDIVFKLDKTPPSNNVQIKIIGAFFIFSSSKTEQKSISKNSALWFFNGTKFFLNWFIGWFNDMSQKQKT